MHTLSLSLSPSVLIGVNANLDMPKAFQVNCLGGDVFKRFGMADFVEEKKEEVKTRLKASLLSTTSKSSKFKKGVVAPPPAPVVEDKAAAAAPVVVRKLAMALDDASLLTNPIRVTKNMSEFVRFTHANTRFVPVCGEGHLQTMGVVMLKDTMPEQEAEILSVTVPPTGGVDPNEPPPPETFFWTPPS
jgi:hypothetical protein